MDLAALLPHLAPSVILHWRVLPTTLIIDVAARASGACCPGCHQLSTSVHSTLHTYRRFRCRRLPHRRSLASTIAPHGAITTMVNWSSIWSVILSVATTPSRRAKALQHLLVQSQVLLRALGRRLQIEQILVTAEIRDSDPLNSVPGDVIVIQY